LAGHKNINREAPPIPSRRRITIHRGSMLLILLPNIIKEFRPREAGFASSISLPSGPTGLPVLMGTKVENKLQS